MENAEYDIMTEKCLQTNILYIYSVDSKLRNKPEKNFLDLPNEPCNGSFS